MNFFIPLIIWIILRIILFIFTKKDKSFGKQFYKGLYVSIALDFVFLILIFYWYLKVKFLFTYLISITLLTFLYYGLDKFLAEKGMFRIPEKVLLFLSLIGGTVGALLGMFLFHHKTKKVTFQIWFWIVVVIQVAIVYLIHRYVLR